MRALALTLLVALVGAAPRTADAGLVFEHYLHERATETEAAVAALRSELEAGGELVASPARLRVLLGTAAPRPPLRDRALTGADLLAHISVGYKAYLDGRFDQAIPQLTAALEEGHANPALLVAGATYRNAMLDALVGLATSHHRRNKGDDRARALAVMEELIRSFPDRQAGLRDAYGPDPDAIHKLALKQLQARGTGSLVVAVDAPDALIFLDEAAQPVNATFQANLPPGDYRVLVKRPTGEARRFDVAVVPGKTTKVEITWEIARALTVSEHWVGFAGVEERTAIGSALAIAQRHRHALVVLITAELVGTQRAIRATLYRASDGMIARAHQVVLGDDVPARMRALARVVRLGGRAREPLVETLGARAAVTAGAGDREATDAAPSPRRRTPWLIGAAVSGGLGLVALGAAGKFALDARAAGEDLRTTCAVACTSEEARGFEAAQRRGNERATIAAAVGGAAVIGGVVLWLLAPSAREAAAVAVTPARGGGVVTYAWTF